MHNKPQWLRCFRSLSRRALNGRRRNPGNDPVPIVWKAGWALGSAWKGAKKFNPTGDSPARSQSLYRLRYLGPLILYISYNKYRLFPHRVLTSFLIIMETPCVLRGKWICIQNFEEDRMYGRQGRCTWGFGEVTWQKETLGRHNIR
jgi:hypothetical protein